MELLMKQRPLANNGHKIRVPVVVAIHRFDSIPKTFQSLALRSSAYPIIGLVIVWAQGLYYFGPCLKNMGHP